MAMVISKLYLKILNLREPNVARDVIPNYNLETSCKNKYCKPLLTILL